MVITGAMSCNFDISRRIGSIPLQRQIKKKTWLIMSTEPEHGLRLEFRRDSTVVVMPPLGPRAVARPGIAKLIAFRGAG